MCGYDAALGIQPCRDASATACYLLPCTRYPPTPRTMAVSASAADWVKEDKRRMLHAVYRVGELLLWACCWPSSRSHLPALLPHLQLLTMDN